MKQGKSMFEEIMERLYNVVFIDVTPVVKEPIVPVIDCDIDNEVYKELKKLTKETP